MKRDRPPRPSAGGGQHRSPFPECFASDSHGHTTNVAAGCVFAKHRKNQRPRRVVGVAGSRGAVGPAGRSSHQWNARYPSRVEVNRRAAGVARIRCGSARRDPPSSREYGGVSAGAYSSPWQLREQERIARRQRKLRALARGRKWLLPEGSAPNERHSVLMRGGEENTARKQQ